jgi:hypothetical protein
VNRSVDEPKFLEEPKDIDNIEVMGERSDRAYVGSSWTDSIKTWYRVWSEDFEDGEIDIARQDLDRDLLEASDGKGYTKRVID